MESTTSGTIMAELENWRYYAGSYQTIREILYISHQVTQIIPKISGQSKTIYKNHCNFHSEFYWLYCYPLVIQQILSQ